MHVPLNPGYVLHTRAYRETSLLVEVLSRDHGRLGLVAKGARRPRSALASAAQPFRVLQLAWSGRGELATLTRAEPEGSGWHLTGTRLASAMYLNELLYRLLPRHDPVPALFEQYRTALAGLAGGAATEACLRIFEKRLLQVLGYALVLEHEADTGAPIDPRALYRYEMQAGPRPAASGCPGPQLHGESLLALAAESLAAERSLREVKQLMRAVLAVQLDGKPLRSRELLRSRRAGG